MPADDVLELAKSPENPKVEYDIDNSLCGCFRMTKQAPSVDEKKP